MTAFSGTYVSRSANGQRIGHPVKFLGSAGCAISAFEHVRTALAEPTCTSSEMQLAERPEPRMCCRLARATTRQEPGLD